MGILARHGDRRQETEGRRKKKEERREGRMNDRKDARSTARPMKKQVAWDARAGPPELSRVSELA